MSPRPSCETQQAARIEPDALFLARQVGQQLVELGSRWTVTEHTG